MENDLDSARPLSEEEMRDKYLTESEKELGKFLDYIGRLEPLTGPDGELYGPDCPYNDTMPRRPRFYALKKSKRYPSECEPAGPVKHPMWDCEYIGSWPGPKRQRASEPQGNPSRKWVKTRVY